MCPCRSWRRVSQKCVHQPLLGSMSTLFLNIRIHLHRYGCQLYSIIIRSFWHHLPDNTADVQSHIFSHQLDFSTRRFHRSLKLNGIKTKPTVLPINAVVPSVVFLSQDTPAATPESGSQAQLPCSTFPPKS